VVLLSILFVVQVTGAVVAFLCDSGEDEKFAGDKLGYRS